MKQRLLKISIILFLLGGYIGFVYTLVMATNVTTFSLYKAYLHTSTTTYVDAAQKTNQLLFSLSTTAVVISVLIYALRFLKTDSVKRKISALVVGVVTFIIHLISLIKIIELNLLYAKTDTSWTSMYMTPEQVNYTHPGNLYVQSGLFVFSITIIFIIMFIIMVSLQFKKKKVIV